MDKIKQCGLVVLGVVMTYLVLSVFIKFVSDQSISTNQTLAAAHNMSNYPGTSGFLLFTPWLLYFVPAVIGIALIIIILKGPVIQEVVSRWRYR